MSDDGTPPILSMKRAAFGGGMNVRARRAGGRNRAAGTGLAIEGNGL